MAIIPVIQPPKATDQIVERDGRPTARFSLFLEQLIRRLLPILTGSTGEFLNGEGEFATPSVGPIDAQYLVATSSSTLTAERVTTDTGTIAWDYATGGQAKANVVDGSITPTKLNPNAKADVVRFVFNGISTGVAGFVSVPYSGTITSWRLLSTDPAVTSGSIVVDVWKDLYANYPPTVLDTITAAAKPTITTATKAESSTLTGWTTTVTVGDVLGFNVDSVTSLTQATLEIFITRT